MTQPMARRAACLIALAVFTFASSSGAQDGPRPALPFVSRVCPFRYCAPATWMASVKTPLFASLRRGARVTTILEAGTNVRGVSGLVVTTRLGQAAVRGTLTAGYPPVTLSSRDPVFVLYPSAEGGEFAFWSQGVSGTTFIPDQNGCRRNSIPECQIQMTELPHYTFWVQVRTQDGREGWTRQLDHFASAAVQ